MTRTWLITGASRGLGRALAVAALAAGDRVAGTARDAADLADLAEMGGDDRVLPLVLDVTDHDAVDHAVARALAWSDGIDVLVNNAGHGLAGAFEELTSAQMQQVLDVNLGGVMAVTRAVLPSMRARRSGHLVQMSSVGGVVANPGHAAYATSKFALEGLSEALAGELAPFGIRVTIVEPGPFRTDFAGASMAFADPIADYADTPAGRLRARFPSQDGRQPGDPARAAAAVLAVLDDPDAPLRLPLGKEAVDRLRAKLAGQLADLDRRPERSATTDF